MNADEIVRALRDYARAYNAGTPYDFSPAIAIQAGNEINHLKAEIFGQANLIESLQAQLNDVVPVVRGEWVYSRTQSEFAVSKCSNCGKEQFSISHVVVEGNYCPNCGAKMEDKP